MFLLPVVTLFSCNFRLEHVTDEQLRIYFCIHMHSCVESEFKAMTQKAYEILREDNFGRLENSVRWTYETLL